MDKKFFAFISYKREDEKEAKKLQNKLGYYRFPTNLNGNTDLPKRIAPIFRDVTDLNPGPLVPQIEAALDDSQWLIVVCSPRGAKSLWVGKEAQYFIDSGRADHIIPFIIEGTPFSGDEKTECYPEALRKLTGKDELLGANINEMGKEAAFVKVVARMFGLDFDTLWQGYRRQQRRRRIIQCVAGFLFFIFLLVVGFTFYWLKMEQADTAKEKEKIEIDLHKTRLTNLLEGAQKECERGNLAKALRLSLCVLNDSLSNDINMLAAEKILRKCATPVTDAPYSMLILDSICDSYLFSYAFTPDGKYLLTNSKNSVLKWDAKTGKCLNKISLHKKRTSSIAISKNGEYFLTTADSTLRVWYTDTFEPKTGPMKHNGYVSHAFFCPADDRKILSRTIAHEVSLWDTETGDLIIQPIKFEDNVVDIAWSPDGSSFATNSYYKEKYPPTDETRRLVRVWNSETGGLINEFKGHTGGIRSVNYSPDSKYIVTASDDTTARVWNVLTGTPLYEPLQHNGGVTSAVFSPDGKYIVTAASDNTACVWNVLTGTPLYEPLQHNRGVSSAVFSPDGKYIVTAALFDNTIGIWDVLTGKPVTEEPLQHKFVNSAVFNPVNRDVMTLANDSVYLWNLSFDRSAEYFEHESYLYSVKYTSDGNYILANEGDAVKVLDVENFNEVTSINYNASILWAAFSPDEKYIITLNTDNTVCVWDRFSGELVFEPLKHDSPVLDATYSPDGNYVLTTSSDSTARIWNAKNGELAFEPLKHNSDVFDATYSPDSNYILTRGVKTVSVWNAKNGELAFEPFKHNSLVFGATYSPDGNYIITESCDSTFRIWNAKNGELAFEPLKHDSYIRDATYSPDGNYFFTTSGDSTVRVWDAKNGELAFEPLKHNSFVGNAIYSPDGNYILTTSSDSTVRVWDAKNGGLAFEPLKHNRVVWNATFSPDGNYILTLEGEIVNVWNANTAELAFEPLKHNSVVWNATFSPDGNYILTTSSDKVVNVWRASNGERVARNSRHGALYLHLNDFNSAVIGDGEKYILTTSKNGSVIKWDAKTDEVVGAFYLVDVSSVVFSKNNDYTLAVGEDGYSISLRNNIENTSVNKEFLKEITSAFFTPNGDGVLIAYDSTVCVLDLNMENIILGPLEHGGDVISASYDPEGKYIVTTSNDDVVRVWKTATGLIYKELKSDEWSYIGSFCSAVFSSDGNKLIFAHEDGDIYIWDTKEWKQRLYIEEDLDLKSAVFSSDGKYILVATEDDVRVLDAENGKLVYEIEFYDGTIISAAFSPKDNYIIIAKDSDEYMCLLPFPTLQELIDKYRNDPEHDWSLSAEEKKEYSLE